jgi:hypothetical protein
LIKFIYSFLGIKSILAQNILQGEYNYRLARIDAKTKTITDIADLSIEVRRYANEYQTKKNKKQNCVTIGLLTHSPLQEFYLILKVLPEGLLWKRKKAKNKTRRNSIKNRKRKKGIRKIKRNTIYNL